MTLNQRSWCLCEVLGAPIRLLIALFLPIAAFATELQSTLIFILLTSVEVLGILLGVTMFKMRNE